MIEGLLHKEGTDRYYFRAKVDLAKGLLDKQLAFNGTLLEVNNKIQQRSHLGRHVTLCRDELTNVNRNLHKVVYTKLKKYIAELDDVCSRLAEVLVRLSAVESTI